MRPASNSTTTAAVDPGFRHWKSPVPYLFVGLALMLGLISVALIILACSYKNSSSSNLSGGAEEKSNKQVERHMDIGPKIVVIMAGDDNPTYLAKPVSCACQNEQAV